jgi:hypothetical protein
MERLSFTTILQIDHKLKDQALITLNKMYLKIKIKIKLLTILNYKIKSF